MDNHCLNLQLSSPAPVCPELDKLREALSDASAVILGAGAGCSASAGFDYAGERFQRYFSDLKTGTVSTICMRAAFIRIRCLRPTGPSGAET